MASLSFCDRQFPSPSSLCGQPGRTLLVAPGADTAVGDDGGDGARRGCNCLAAAIAGGRSGRGNTHRLGVPKLQRYCGDDRGSSWGHRCSCLPLPECRHGPRVCYHLPDRPCRCLSHVTVHPSGERSRRCAPPRTGCSIGRSLVGADNQAASSSFRDPQRGYNCCPATINSLRDSRQLHRRLLPVQRIRGEQCGVRERPQGAWVCDS